MTTEKKTATDKGRGNKLKLKKETLKDLDAKKEAKVKGGAAYIEPLPPPVVTDGCPPPPPATNCVFFTCLVKR
jgi:hypothetical protein